MDTNVVDQLIEIYINYIMQLQQGGHARYDVFKAITMDT